MTDPGKKISKNSALHIYRALLKPRLIEERMLSLLRQSKITKWFSGIGQEAISVGLTLSVDKDDYILPMHRNLGVFTTREVSLYPLFCQLFGKAEGFTGGRDRSFHFGLPDKKIIGMISHLAATMPVADGLALALKLSHKNNVAFSFCGDGATSEGDFHEALNLAAVWELPVVFVIENNGYGLSTPVSEQYACDDLADRAAGYGMESMIIDGNDIFDVMSAVDRARRLALTGKPVLIEAKTFRMRGHEESSGTFYVPDLLFENWVDKDPVARFEKWMLDQGYFEKPDEFEEIRKEVKSEFEAPLKKALKSAEPEFDKEKELGDAWFINSSATSERKTDVESHEKCERRFIDGIQKALYQAFEEDPSFVLMGQDIAEYGGVFKVSEGFVEKFGKERIRNTPIIESGAVGASIGLSLGGYKPVLEMQFADFISCAYNQIANNVSKSVYRWMPSLNLTIRAPHGAGIGSGPFHSQSPEGWFMQHPGLRILVPATVEDAQNMLYTSLFDENPVLFFEHKKLYRSIRDTVPEKCRIVDLERAKTHKKGNDAVIITYGMGVHWALKTAESFSAKKGYSIEVLDLRSLAPIDWLSISSSLKKTGKVLLLQEPSEILGPMSEISAGISENYFEHLDAPIMRCSSLNMPVPFNKNLENKYLASSRLSGLLNNLLIY